MPFEHYRVFIEESKRFCYYINSKGYYERFDKRKWKDNRMLECRFEKVAMYLHRRTRVRSKINGRFHYPKYDVIKKFTSMQDLTQRAIIHLDSDVWNCNIENLRVVKMSKIVKRRDPQCKRVGVGRGVQERVYGSISALAREYYISKGAITLHLQGKTHSEYLASLNVHYIDN